MEKETPTSHDGEDTPEGEALERDLMSENLPALPVIDVVDGEGESSVDDEPRHEQAGDLVISDPLERYLAEIRHVPTLSREEERELAIRYFEQGDKMAGYRLVMANLRLVVMIAREYQRNVQNILDLVQEGNLGLLEAVKQFDPYRGIRFPSYAVYWIRAYMLRYLINNLRLVKIGTTQAQRKLFFNLQKEKEKLEAEGFVPEAKLLAERLEVKESEVLEMEQRLALPDLSVDAPIRTASGETTTLHGLLADTGATTEDRIAEHDFRESLRTVVERFKAQLDDKERAVIEQRLMTEDPVTLQTIADQFGLSRERIRQIENRLKERLKEVLADELKLDAFGEVIVDEADEEGLSVVAVLVVIIVLCLVAGAGFLKWRSLAKDPKTATYAHFFERNPPKVTFPVRIPGIGAEPGKIAIDITDDGAGIDEVVVRCDQDGDVKELLRKRYTERQVHDRVEVPINGKALHLNQGAAAVHVSVFDKSFWSNGVKDSFDFLVDYGRPKLSVISIQHNAVLGGSELVFYRLDDEGSPQSGVRIGEDTFRGTAALKLDSAFSSIPRLYFTYVAFPAELAEGDVVNAFAIDEVGNTGTAGFYYRTQQTRRLERKRVIAQEIVEKAVGELLPALGTERANTAQTLGERFALLNGDYRAETERKLRKILGETAEKHYAERFPLGPFLRQRGGIGVDFGENQQYYIVNDLIGSAVSTGADFLTPSGTPVFAAEAGRIIYADDLGTYGKTVVLDHGFGVATVYAFLQDFRVAPGNEMKQGDVLGSSGSSGLALGERVRFEVRVHGVPVRPIEWWDKHWLRDHFGLKVKEVKDILGIAVTQESPSGEASEGDSAERRR